VNDAIEGCHVKDIKSGERLMDKTEEQHVTAADTFLFVKPLGFGSL